MRILQSHTNNTTMVHLLRYTTKYLLKSAQQLPIKRSISALYITGDKAKKNYAPLQPYMDFEETLNQQEPLEESIKARKLHINLDELKTKYAKFQSMKNQIKQVEEERESVSKKLKELNKVCGKRWALPQKKSSN
uniref:Uncharacterized protein n=1 Tax=Bactrocera dorsalis TaxID=27457 RepID=A0A034VNL9_BACDO